MSPLHADIVAKHTTRATAAMAVVVLGAVIVFVTAQTVPALRDIGPTRFLTDDAWRPIASSGELAVGLLPMLVGSVLVTALALLIAAPIGILCALLCNYYAPPAIATAQRCLLAVLAGMPSVLLGFWGLVVLVPHLNRIRPPGHSLLAGALILALMIIPTVALTSEASFRSTPAEQLRAAAALGLSRWTTFRHVVFPPARLGITAGMLLAMARALGETMVVVMVCGNVVQVPSEPFQPVRTVTANIALEMGYATEAHRSVLFVSGLFLLLVVSVLVFWMNRLCPGTQRE